MRALVLTLLVLTGCSGSSATGGSGGSGGGTSSTGGGSGGSGGSGGGTMKSVVSIAVTGGSSLEIPMTLTLTATATYSDATTADVSATAAWASNEPTRAAVSTTGVVTAQLPGAVEISATVGGVTGQAALTITGVGLVSLAITPSMPELGIGATQPFTVTGTFSDATTRNLTATSTWSSSVPQLATVTAAGVVSALALGNTNISARAGPVTGATGVKVTAKTVRALAITPSFVSITTAGTQQLTATATYTDGTTGDVSGSVTWTSQFPAVVTVSAAGLVTPLIAGSGNGITANVGQVSATARVSVTTPANALTAISFMPMTMWVGSRSPPFQVDATFGMFGQNYSFVSWTTSDATVLSIDGDGFFTARKVGTSTMTARSGALMTSNTVTVIEPPLMGLTVLPAASVIAQGATLQLVANGVFGNPALNKDLASTAMWTSSNPAAITVDATGLAKGLGPGTATLTAKSGAIMGTMTATVPPNVPPMMTVTLPVVSDNSIIYSSLTPSSQTKVYPVNALFPQPGLAVGCSWLYSPQIGFAPEHVDALCGSALIKFNLGALSGKTILSAKLRLTTSAYGVGFVPRRWFIYALASPWDGATVTWNQANGFQHYVYSQTQHDPPSFSGQVFELDQTTTVKNWVGGGYQSNGWQLGLVNPLLPYVTSSSLDAFELHSSEDPNGRGPKLVVTYQ